MSSKKGYNWSEIFKLLSWNWILSWLDFTCFKELIHAESLGFPWSVHDQIIHIELRIDNLCKYKSWGNLSKIAPGYCTAWAKILGYTWNYALHSYEPSYDEVAESEIWCFDWTEFANYMDEIDSLGMVIWLRLRIVGLGEKVENHSNLSAWLLNWIILDTYT